MSENSGRDDDSGPDDWSDQDAEPEPDDEPARNEESEWRFAVDEVGEDGKRVEVDPIEPGSPRIETVAFFVLGVITMVGVLAVLIFG
jgi:hypothetical protein